MFRPCNACETPSACGSLRGAPGGGHRDRLPPGRGLPEGRASPHHPGSLWLPKCREQRAPTWGEGRPGPPCAGRATQVQEGPSCLDLR